MPFVVFALPRSRTAWMSHFLSYGSANVGHDIGIECRSIADFLVPFQHGMIGTVETGSMIAWRQIREIMPRCKFVVVKRPIWQVLHSLLRFGLAPPVEEMIARDEILDEIGELPGTLAISFDELSGRLGAVKLFEFCLEKPFDPEWYRLVDGINIQVSMPERISQLERNAAHLAALKASLRDASFQLPGNA